MGRHLVTGCAGFIGSHLVDALLARGDSVLGIDAFTEYYARSRKQDNLRTALECSRFALLEADLATDPLEPLLDGVTCVFHLAGQPGARGGWDGTFASYVKANVLATQRVFEAAARTGSKVIAASSSSVYGDAARYPTPEEAPLRPRSPYGVTKATGESLAEAYAGALGLEVVTLRYFTVYGPRQRPDMAVARIVEALRTGAPFRVYGTGEQSRELTFVSDAVGATIAASAAPPGRTYNVGGGTEASLLDVISICEGLSGRSLTRVPDDAASGDLRRTAADTTRIRDELGWKPAVGLSEGLESQLHHAGLV